MNGRRNLSVVLGIAVVFLPTWFGMVSIDSGLQAGVFAGAGAALGLLVYEVIARMQPPSDD